MRNHKMIHVLILLISFMACKQQNEPKSIEIEAKTSTRISEENIEQAIVKLYNGIINKERLPLDQVTSDKLTYGHSSGIVQTKSEFIDDVINGPFTFGSISHDNLKVTISGDTAIVRHIFKAEATNAGQPIKIRIGVMMVFQLNENGQLILLGRQAYKLA